MRISDWSSDVCSSDLWQNVKTLEARASVGGAIWPLKGWEGHLEDASFTVDAQHQHVEYRSGAAPGQRSIYEPDRTSIVADDGQLVGERTSPRASFADHKVKTPWDSQPSLYFRGYANWKSGERRVGEGCVRKCRSRWS